MKIYTKTGDQGQTGLFAGPRVVKHHPRVEAYGDVDELNAALGVARAQSLPPDCDTLVERIQHELFALGAELATPDPAKRGSNQIDEAMVSRLENAIDHFETFSPPLTHFILPGGTHGAAALHLARTICRRAERRVTALRESPNDATPTNPTNNVSDFALQYLNRLSDLLFVLARAVNAIDGKQDIIWRSQK